MWSESGARPRNQLAHLDEKARTDFALDASHDAVFGRHLSHVWLSPAGISFGENGRNRAQFRNGHKLQTRKYSRTATKCGQRDEGGDYRSVAQARSQNTSRYHSKRLPITSMPATTMAAPALNIIVIRLTGGRLCVSARVSP
jgi:hypothetical protein